MTLFRIFLVSLWLSLVGYTAIVITNHGMGFLPVFFGDIANMKWPGQFNLDFSCMLLLGAIWVAWRHGFSTKGWALAFLVPIGGASFLTLYLLAISFQCNGDTRMMALGHGA